MINQALEKYSYVMYRRRLNPNVIVAITIFIFFIIISFCTYLSYKNMKESMEENVKKLNTEIIELKNDIKQSDVFTESLLERLTEKGSVRAKVTMYHPPSGGINSDSDPTMTATMTRPIAGITCAISTKMVEEDGLERRYISMDLVFL